MGLLILVRHSISQPEPGVSAHGWKLTDQGREKVVALAQRIYHFGVQKVISSDEPKAVETAQLLAESLGKVAVDLTEELRETHRKTAPYYADRAEFSRAIQHAIEHPAELLYGEETFEAAQLRFSDFVSKITSEDIDGAVLLVSHGTILSLYIAHVTGLDAFALWNLLDMPAYAVFSLPELRLCEICFSLV